MHLADADRWFKLSYLKIPKELHVYRKKNIHIDVRIQRIRMLCGMLFFYKYMNPTDSVLDTKTEKRQVEMHPLGLNIILKTWNVIRLFSFA